MQSRGPAEREVSGQIGRMPSTIKRAMRWMLLAATACLASSANAQVNTADLSGIVTDPTGAALPHARIAVVNGGTGYTRSLESDNAGAYSFQDLPIGEYKVTVAEQGFWRYRTSRHSGCWPKRKAGLSSRYRQRAAGG